MKYLYEKNIECPEEFGTALTFHFPAARSFGTREIRFYEDPFENDDNYVLKVRFKKHIPQFERGPCLTETFYQNLKEKLDKDLAKTTLKVASYIFFSYNAVDGYFRKDNDFQILPPPTNAPLSQLCKEKPFIIQHSFFDSPNEIVKQQRKAIRRNEIFLLLNMFITRRIMSRPSNVGMGWITCEDGEKKYCFTGYTIDDFRDEQTDFDPVTGFKQLNQLNFEDYYGKYLTYANEPLTIPSDLEHLFNHFSKLPKVIQEKFLRASYWLDYSSTVWSISKSASLTAIITSLEALMDKKQNKDVKKCSECGRRVEISSNQRFYEFISCYLHGDKEMIKSIYGLRSNLSHGDILLEMDKNLFDFSAINERDSTQYMNYLYARHIAIVLGVNWMREQSI